ncbi:MAG: hypothetical protein U1E99_11165 [Agitococcus sp.]
MNGGDNYAANRNKWWFAKRFTDPYSYLLIQTLPNFISHFDVKPIFKLLPYQEPNQFLLLFA